MRREDEAVALRGLAHDERADQRALGEVERRLALLLEQRLELTLLRRRIEGRQVDERHLDRERRPERLAWCRPER